MRVSMRDAHAVRCDWKPTKPDYVGPGFCAEVFRSNSKLTVLRGQLEAAGWTIIPGSRTTETAHLCPAHRPEPGHHVTPPTEWSQRKLTE